MIELDELLRATAAQGGEVIGAPFARAFAAFSHDSRTVSPGELFVALRTEKADGHDFIDDAVLRGAVGVLCERPPAGGAAWGATGVTVIRVRDTRAALHDWATFALASVRPYRMAVAGAVGKSAARAALLRALGPAEDVFSNGNRNDELGLPLALGELGAGHRLAVLEVAAGSGAELNRLGALLQPDAALLTSAGAPSAQDAASVSVRDGLAGFLAALAPGGLLIVNADDAELARLLDCAGTKPRAGRLLSYGLNLAADLTGTVLEETHAGTLLAIGYQGDRVTVRLQAPGRGAVSAALAGVAGALALGGGLVEAAARLDGLPPEPGRLAPIAGAGGRVVLDDSFSASATSLALALRTLDLFPAPRMAVLGEISGVTNAAALDAETLQRLLALDRLVLQGRELAALGRELRGRSPRPERVFVTYSARDSADALPLAAAPPTRPAASADEGGRPLSDAGEHSADAGAVLVKGSDAARMERVVALLAPEAVRAGAALVRQDEGWRRRTYVPNERPTWVEVDLGAIRANLQALRAAAAPAEVMAVLKADAYGHGARWVARTAALNGAAMLGVASLNEALDLRAEGIAFPILILGYSPPWQARDLALSDVHATLFSLPVAEHFARVARDHGREITVHIKVDTGMTRLGVLPDDVLPFVDAVAALPGLRLEGIFSHLATADSDLPFAIEQAERFAAVVRALAAAGHRFRYVHLENSAAALRSPRLAAAAGCNLVRAGMALYGLYPLPRAETDVTLQPALAFKTRVAQVKHMPAGTSISYGRTYITPAPARIAILPVGYGDGFRRSPRNWGHVLVRGRRAPIRGVVAMDMTMVDVTAIPGVQEGDEVVLIGRQGNEAITAEDAAAALGTIAYEVVTQILARVPRQTR